MQKHNFIYWKIFFLGHIDSLSLPYESIHNYFSLNSRCIPMFNSIFNWISEYFSGMTLLGNLGWHFLKHISALSVALTLVLSLSPGAVKCSRNTPLYISTRTGSLTFSNYLIISFKGRKVYCKPLLLVWGEVIARWSAHGLSAVKLNGSTSWVFKHVRVHIVTWSGRELCWWFCCCLNGS